MGWVVWIGGEKEESELSEERNRVYTTVLYNDHKKIEYLLQSTSIGIAFLPDIDTYVY